MAMIKCPECNGDVSDKAVTCPHCGYPIKTTETNQYEYVLEKGHGTVSRLSGLLRILAVITWAGGVIIAISGANVADSLYSSHFSFAAFLTILIPYAIYGFIMFGMATLADQIADTNSIVNGLKLERKQQKKDSEKPAGKSTYSEKVSMSGWTCPVCHHDNNAWDEYCSNCSEPKRNR